jgi:hypothetical protein
MSENEYVNLRLAHARMAELMEAKQRTSLPRARRRKTMADSLRRFADRLEH